MRLSIRTWLAMGMAVLLVAVPMRNARAQTATPPCVIGYTVGFFNGVWNTELEAIDGRNALQAAVREVTGNSDDTFNHEDVNYELFYNHTGSTVGATGLQDIAEVFEQRAQQLDPSGSLFGANFYLFWEPFNGQPPGYADTSGSVNQTLQTFLTDFQNTVVQNSLTTLSSLFSNPPTTADYATQWATLDTLGAAGRKLLLVAHSQGNLFVDPAYDHIMPVVGATRVKVVHVAPASPTLRGNYELANIDAVINGLRLVNGFNTIPNINLTLALSSSDPSGHTLVGTYLDASRPGRANTEMLLNNGLGALVMSTCAVTVSPSSATVTQGSSSNTTLTAKLTMPVTDSTLQVSYGWSVTGNAGGMLQAGFGAPSTSVASLSPTVTYVSSAAATANAIDTVTLTVYVGPALGDPTKDETLGTANAVLTVQPSNAIQNGNFSQGLMYWNSFGTTQASISTSVVYNQDCYPSQNGNPFAILSVYGADGGIQQTFTVPTNATQLTLRTWNNLDPVKVTISMVSSGVETVLGSLNPPSLQALSDPNNYYSVVCTNATPATVSYDVSSFRGQSVTLRLRGTYLTGVNGTFASFDDVTILH